MSVPSPQDSAPSPVAIMLERSSRDCTWDQDSQLRAVTTHASRRSSRHDWMKVLPFVSNGREPKYSLQAALTRYSCPFEVSSNVRAMMLVSSSFYSCRQLRHNWFHNVGCIVLVRSRGTSNNALVPICAEDDFQHCCHKLRTQSLYEPCLCSRWSVCSQRLLIQHTRQTVNKKHSNYGFFRQTRCDSRRVRQ